MNRYAASTQEAPNGRGTTPVAPRGVTALEHRGPVPGRRSEVLYVDVARVADARGAFLHVAVLDAGGWAYTEVLGSSNVRKCAAFALRAMEQSRSRNFSVRQLISDNAFGWHARPLADKCRGIGVRLDHMEPLNPTTAAHTERLMRVALVGWASDAHVGDICEWTHARSGWAPVGDQQ